ncbi:hypothetical protein H5410_040108 [Solanum commersonii]|uniref:Pectinesterase catalytic domain-containing protein n=1 Tax=Solanum commersonii TaxID=4109 RepID=A0A9J5XP54_SOLCO|nr:hypothetical protein H5410_040108 [Solanum commersonii]
MNTIIITGNISFGDGNKTYDTTIVGSFGMASQHMTSTLGMMLDRINTKYPIYKTDRQFYRDCEIYIRIPLPKQYNTTTTQQRELQNTPTKVVLQNCTLKANKDLNNVATNLGRSWDKFS